MFITFSHDTSSSHIIHLYLKAYLYSLSMRSCLFSAQLQILGIVTSFKIEDICKIATMKRLFSARKLSKLNCAKQWMMISKKLLGHVHGKRHCLRFWCWFYHICVSGYEWASNTLLDSFCFNSTSFYYDNRTYISSQKIVKT